MADTPPTDDTTTAPADDTDASAPDPASDADGGGFPKVIGQIGNGSFVIDVDGTYAVLVEDGEPRRPVDGQQLMKRLGGYLQDVTDQAGADEALAAWEANPTEPLPADRAKGDTRPGTAKRGSKENPKPIFIDDEQNANWLRTVRKMREEAAAKGEPDPVTGKVGDQGPAPTDEPAADGDSGSERPVINLDADPENANRLHRKDGPKPKRQPAADGDAVTAAVDDDESLFGPNDP